MQLLQLLLLLLLLCCCCCSVLDAVRLQRRAAARTFTVGAVMERGDQIRQIALKAAIEDANRIFMSSDDFADVELMDDIRFIDSGDNFGASRETCSLLEASVVAVIGPPTASASEQVQSVCEFFTVPFISTSWTLQQRQRQEQQQQQQQQQRQQQHYTINLNPHFDSFGQAILDFASALGKLDQIAIVYKSSDSLLKFEKLLNAVNSPVLLRQWRKESGTYQYVMKDLRNSKIVKLFVDIPVEEMVTFIEIAKQMNMTTPYHSYIFTSWDAQRIDMSGFEVVKGANVSTLTLLPLMKDYEQYGRGDSVEDMRERIFNLEKRSGRFGNLTTNMLPTKAALLYDSVLLLSSALRSMSRSKAVIAASLSCRNARKFWNLGATLLNYMRFTPREIAGQTITGDIQFNANWQRTNFTLRALELSADGFHEVGEWTPNNGFNMTKTYSETQEEYQRNLQNKTLRVTTIPDPPFVEIKKRDSNGNPLPEPSAWDGFCIEMLNMIAEDVGFNYTVHVVRDNSYGSVNGSDAQGKETWNGMIGELMNREADLAVASLTITYERERVIDFTTPFMSLGLSILFKKPEKKRPHLFSFLQPLSAHVWGYMLAAYIIVSFVLFVVARFSPYEWSNPHPCNPRSDQVENQFSLLNSLWFTIGSLMQQGSEISPRALSTRIVSGIWWFFTLIMISSYTANLAAFLTVERMQSPIKSVEDLAAQTKIRYGTLYGGSTYQFFKRSKSIAVFKKMWDYMSKRPDVFVNKTGEGIERVKAGGYAFILESTWNEYYTQRNCELMQVGGLLDSKGYGIGLPDRSPYRDMISESILKFQKLQHLENLRRKWWRQKNITVPCEDTKNKNSEPSGLGVDQVAGVFVALAIGISMGLVVVAFEFCFKACKRAECDRQPLAKELCQELAFAMKCCSGSTRPANHMARRAQRARDRAATAGGMSHRASAPELRTRRQQQQQQQQQLLQQPDPRGFNPPSYAASFGVDVFPGGGMGAGAAGRFVDRQQAEFPDTPHRAWHRADTFG